MVPLYEVPRTAKGTEKEAEWQLPRAIDRGKRGGAYLKGQSFIYARQESSRDPVHQGAET